MSEKGPDFVAKKFAVVGAGPVGCIVAAFLSKGGYDVTLCDVIPALVDPAATTGIYIEGAENLHQTIPHICHGVEELAQYDPDVIFITVKAIALSLICSVIEEFRREGRYVVSWQNGIDTELEFAKTLGKKAVMRGVVYWGCGLKGPCRVEMGFHRPPHYLQELAPESAHAAVEIARILTECGLPTEHTDKITSMVWQKSVLNASTNPVCAVTGLTLSQAMNDPIIFGIVDSLVKECIEVARANEIFLGFDFYQHAIEVIRMAGGHKPSMLMDIEAGRRTEIDFINGKFVEYGKRAGIETPYSTALQSLIKGLESALEAKKRDAAPSGTLKK